MAPGFKSGGRQRGSLNKSTIAVRSAGKIAPADYKSLGHMRKIAQWFMIKAEEAEAKVDKDGKPDPDLKAAAGFYHDALIAQKAIAEYEFSKLSALAPQGDPNRPSVTRIEVELVESQYEKRPPLKLIEGKPVA